MKKKISNSFIIGIFVFTGLAVLVAFVLWMGATQFFKEYVYYTTYFSESVQGLESGSSIKYLGVPCGMVDEISIAPDGKLVQVVMKIDLSLRVSDSLCVQLEMAGLAGGKFLQLYKATNQYVSNININFDPPYPVINSAPSNIGEITESAGKIIQDISQIPWYNISQNLTTSLDGSSKLLNNKELSLIISDLHRSTTTLAEVLERINNLNIYENIERTTGTLAKSAEELNKLVLDINAEVKKMNLSQHVEKMYLTYDTTAKNINKSVINISNRIETSFISVNSLIQDLMFTNKNLQKTLRILNESPYMLLTEPPKEDKIKK